jgi:hypothetical protein
MEGGFEIEHLLMFRRRCCLIISDFPAWIGFILFEPNAIDMPPDKNAQKVIVSKQRKFQEII